MHMPMHQQTPKGEHHIACGQPGAVAAAPFFFAQRQSTRLVAPRLYGAPYSLEQALEMRSKRTQVPRPHLLRARALERMLQRLCF